MAKVLCLAFHILVDGNGRVVGLVDQGYGLTAVVERLDNDELFEWFREMRSRVGVNVIPLDDNAGLRVSAALKDNQVVSLLCDRDIPRDGVRSGVEVEFFGERTTVPAGPAFFALRTGAALLPLATYFTRKSDGHHTVVRPPIPVERQGGLARRCCAHYAITDD